MKEQTNTTTEETPPAEAIPSAPEPVADGAPVAETEPETAPKLVSRDQLAALQATIDEALELLKKATSRAVPADLDIRVYRGPSGKLLVPVAPGEALVVTSELRSSLPILEAGRHVFEPYTAD